MGMGFQAPDPETNFYKSVMKHRKYFQLKYCLLETALGAAVTAAGQEKAKDIEAVCKDVPDVMGMNQSYLVWWGWHRGWNGKTRTDEVR